jgi:hypothetical protein
MSKSELPAINRRTVFAGAGAAGALGVIAAATGLPRAAPAVQVISKVADAKSLETGGYQLTDHVKQYYATARI